MPRLIFISGGELSAGPVLQYEHTQPWSVAADIRISDTGSAPRIIFSNVDATPFPGYELFVDMDGFLHVRIMNHFGEDWIAVYGATFLADGIQRRVAATYDGSGTAAGIKLYVNGVAETLSTEADALTGSIANSNNFLIGAQASLGGFAFQEIGLFHMSDIVRNGTWVSANATIGTMPTVDGNTVLAYAMSEGSGTSLNDLSSNNYDGTLTDASLWRAESLGPYVAPPAVPFVQSCGNATNSAPTSSAFGSNVTAGNFIAVAVTAYGASAISVSDNLGNTYTLAVTAGDSGQSQRVFYAKNITGGACTITVDTTPANQYATFEACEYSGIDTVAPLDGTLTNSGSSRNPTTGNIAVSQTGTLLFAGTGQLSGSSIIVSDLPSTVRKANAGGGIVNGACADRMADSAAGIGIELSGTEAGWLMAGASFKPAIIAIPQNIHILQLIGAF